ncbi:MAG: hypothetical protein Q9174_003304 [Haloplaca sp. 1 TL-2023]
MPSSGESTDTEKTSVDASGPISTVEEQPMMHFHYDLNGYRKVYGMHTRVKADYTGREGIFHRLCREGGGVLCGVACLPGSECEQAHKRFFMQNAALMGVHLGPGYESMMVRKVTDAIEAGILNSAGRWRWFDDPDRFQDEFTDHHASWTTPGTLSTVAGGRELKDLARISEKHWWQKLP